jgi:hypothetical protein
MPLSPAVILFIIYGTDFSCLTPAFIGEWFVNLRKRLLDWLAMGHEGDLQPFAGYFASFHDIEAGLIYYHIPGLAFHRFLYRYLHIHIGIILLIKQSLLRCCIMQHLGLPHIDTLSGLVLYQHLIFAVVMDSGLLK